MFSARLADRDRDPDLIPAVPAVVALGRGYELRGSAGPRQEVRFPQSGPYDERRGYEQLPSFVEALSARHFAVTRQARWSPPLERFVDQGGYAIYGEKTRAGLRLYDRDRNPLYEASYPERA